MRLAGVLSESVVDGPGVRFVVFAQGCPHRCPGCHNPETWDADGGEEWPVREILRAVKKKQKQQTRFLKGITLSGGEPFCQAESCALLAKGAKKLGLDVVTYTGYTYEQLVERRDPGTDALLRETDILVDGLFIAALKDVSLRFRGSGNQRLIDMRRTRETGAPVFLA
jgi:anaerobic ribonucleoside-triphosphate reductase activating protein